MVNTETQNSTAEINGQKNGVPKPDKSLFSEFLWVETLIKYRISELCDGNLKSPPPPMPDIGLGIHPYFDWLIEQHADVTERLALSLVLMSQTVPQFLDYLYTKNQYTDQVFTEFGVCFEGDPMRVKPSWQTVFFLLTGSDNLFYLLQYIHSDHWLYRQKHLIMPEEKSENPFLTPLKLNHDLLRQWVYPIALRNVAEDNFPAHEISSALNWDELYLMQETQNGLDQLKLWLKHGSGLLKDQKLKRYINPGIRVLFYGPSGTGKTLTASLLGKEFNLPVYRVDLSQMVSKWIGETEKNLARVFDIAEKQNWILFFDEADSLFSKRGSVSNANDRRANQEVSYLLQRVENYDGTIIMASNLRDNIDEAFIRRFQLIIHFPIPDKNIRAKLWENMLEDTFKLAEDIDLKKIAEDFELTGGSMKNIFRSLMLQLYEREKSEQVITAQDIRTAVHSEQAKSGIYTIRKRY
ncbi:MAG: ATP-binding protein [Flavobacteriales bacterium]|nr:ATP-binding protein [Flavobacteriales bacterium]